MKRNAIDMAISAIKGFPILTLGTCVSTVLALYLLSTDSESWRTMGLIAMIFIGLLWMFSPAIVQDADKLAEVRCSGWQRKIESALAALHRQELHLANQNRYPELDELQRRRFRILSRYRAETTGLLGA